MIFRADSGSQSPRSPALHAELWGASKKNSQPVILHAVAGLFPAFCSDLDVPVVPDRRSKWENNTTVQSCCITGEVAGNFGTCGKHTAHNPE